MAGRTTKRYPVGPARLDSDGMVDACPACNAAIYHLEGGGAICGSCGYTDELITSLVIGAADPQPREQAAARQARLFL